MRHIQFVLQLLNTVHYFTFQPLFYVIIFFNVFKQLPDIDTERRKKLRQGNFFESLDV